MKIWNRSCKPCIELPRRYDMERLSVITIGKVGREGRKKRMWEDEWRKQIAMTSDDETDDDGDDTHTEIWRERGRGDTRRE